MLLRVVTLVVNSESRELVVITPSFLPTNPNQPTNHAAPCLAVTDEDGPTVRFPVNDYNEAKAKKITESLTFTQVAALNLA